MISNFRELKIWQKSKILVKDIYLLTHKYPHSELFGLTNQMRRAAVSIPSNIAEGFNRNSVKEFQRFLNIALGSCAELETQLEISGDLGYLDEISKKSIVERINEISRMTKGMISKF
jgi:four helix bundle protein